MEFENAILAVFLTLPDPRPNMDTQIGVIHARLDVKFEKSLLSAVLEGLESKGLIEIENGGTIIRLTSQGLTRISS